MPRAALAAIDAGHAGAYPHASPTGMATTTPTETAKPTATPTVTGTPTAGATATLTLTPTRPLTPGVTGINGWVTANGAPAAGHALQLRLWNGSVYSTQATATTDTAGRYSFSGVPGLAQGNAYYSPFNIGDSYGDRRVQISY